MKLAEIERNDIEGAIKYLREVRARGDVIGNDDIHPLLLLQDDPTALIAKIREGHLFAEEAVT